MERRQFLTNLVALGAGSVFLSCRNPETQPIPTPTQTETLQKLQNLAPQLAQIVQKGQELANTFPDAFEKARNLPEELLELYQNKEIVLNADFPPMILARTAPVLTQDFQTQKITDIKPRIYLSKNFFNQQKEMQVIAILHEIGHYYDQKSLLAPFVGQLWTPELKKQVENLLNRQALEFESKEYFNDCVRIHAIKLKNPKFKVLQPAPHELIIPGLGRTMFETYLMIMQDNTVSPDQKNYKHPLWQATIASILKLASQQA